MTYKLDTEAARSADQRGQWIDESGAYKGVFTRAEEIEAATGTAGISFSFEDHGGRKCTVSLYTIKKDGTELLGYKQVMALMTCLSLRGIEVKDQKIKKWDKNTKSEFEDMAPVYPDLMNKPIGLFLESREYERSDGGVGKSMEIAGFFRHADEMVASEILDKATKAEQFDRIVGSLKHKPLQRSGHTQASRQSRQSENPADGFDDSSDIPF